MKRCRSILRQWRKLNTSWTSERTEDRYGVGPLKSYVDAGYRRYREGCFYSGEVLKTKAQWLLEEIESVFEG
jgi:hypothetical protein